MMLCSTLLDDTTVCCCTLCALQVYEYFLYHNSSHHEWKNSLYNLIFSVCPLIDSISFFLSVFKNGKETCVILLTAISQYLLPLTLNCDWQCQCQRGRQEKQTHLIRYANCQFPFFQVDGGVMWLTSLTPHLTSCEIKRKTTAMFNVVVIFIAQFTNFQIHHIIIVSDLFT